MSDFLDKVFALPRDEGFALRVIQLMEEDQSKTLEELKREESKKEHERKPEFLRWKREGCSQCRAKGTVGEFITPLTVIKYELYGVHIEAQCRKCKTIEIF